MACSAVAVVPVPPVAMVFGFLPGFRVAGPFFFFASFFAFAFVARFFAFFVFFFGFGFAFFDVDGDRVGGRGGRLRRDGLGLPGEDHRGEQEDGEQRPGDGGEPGQGLRGAQRRAVVRAVHPAKDRRLSPST